MDKNIISHLRAELSQSNRWLKLDDRVLSPAERKEKVDLYDACRKLARDDHDVMATISATIHRLFPDRVAPLSSTPNYYDDVRDMLDFNHHELTTHEDVLRVIDGLEDFWPN